jgi:putative transposase
MLSERRACSLVGLSRSSWRNPPQDDDETMILKERIKALAHERRRFGYRRIHDMLKFEGIAVNHKRVYRLYTEQKLSVKRRKKSKRPITERAELLIPDAPNQVWSIDFVMDSLANGRKLKCLTIADDKTHECVDIAVDQALVACMSPEYWNKPPYLEASHVQYAPMVVQNLLVVLLWDGCIPMKLSIY